MSTSKEYLNFILEQLSGLDGITHKQMMGEYIIYFRGRIAAYLCDDRLLIKPVDAAVKMMPDARYEPPYDGAKDMLLCDNVDDRDFLTALFEAIYPELPEPKKKPSAKRK
ncbi:MAG: TfoX/Sxy family protein [Oscillospiraceae bacterium]|nr:TfoX/Sxy family protein [Oscillospiraceae bacterium]